MTQPKIAICYDFDGTLSPGNMQEYDFMQKIGMQSDVFWQKAHKIMMENCSDEVLSYMRLMIEESKRTRIPFKRQDFKNYGKTLPLYAGVDSWFRRINAYGRKHGIEVEHFIISSGIREMLKGHPIAKNFKYIYASSFMYSRSGNAVWPAVALNYTTKTQCLFRINKGCFDIHDTRINEIVPDDERYIPLNQMIYIGDGSTDVPCMRLVKKENGHSIAVFNPEKETAKTMARNLLHDDRVNFIAPADYRKDSFVEEIVQTIIDKIALDLKIEDLKKQGAAPK